MALILNLETATPVCSVAVGDGGMILSQRTGEEYNIHSEYLTIFIEEVMREAGVTFSRLDGIAVSGGPGSYTGLRIGASVAKGLCFSLDKPLIAISTLQAMAEAMKMHVLKHDAFYCPMIDARRMDVYTALYDVSGKIIEKASAKSIDEASFQDILSREMIVFGGDGALKCRTVITAPNAIFLDDFQYSARGMSLLSETEWHHHRFADTAYFEPFYLKEFHAGKPNVKGLYDKP